MLIYLTLSTSQNLTKTMELKIALIGKGTVGTCFLQLIIDSRELLMENFKLELKIIGIFEINGAIINENGINIADILKLGINYKDSSDWKDNVKAVDAIPTLKPDLLIETTPTNSKTGEPGLSHITEAIKNKIDVISSNKGPFYLKYEKLKELANEHNVFMRFEATVASAVPIISIRENLASNIILGFRAILNGTSNFILSRMTAEGVSFEIALKEAQELGYAETDPALDIEGYDAAGKLVILANELLGWSKSINDVNIKGISKITPHAIELAKSDGYVIKHLAIAEDTMLLVEPRLIERNSPLNISGTLNVIELQTKNAGPIILMGRGAGGFEAASALLNDLIWIFKQRNLM